MRSRMRQADTVKDKQRDTTERDRYTERQKEREKRTDRWREVSSADDNCFPGHRNNRKRV